MTTRKQALVESVQAALGGWTVAVSEALGEVTLIVNSPHSCFMAATLSPNVSFSLSASAAMLAIGKIQRAIVLVRRILFCNWMTPYRSASAVGGHPGT